MPDLTRRSHVGIEESRLAEPPWGRASHRDAVCGVELQLIQLPRRSIRRAGPTGLCKSNEFDVHQCTANPGSLVCQCPTRRPLK